MRIVSPFKDFYDSGQGYDLDRSVIYIREPKELIYERNKYPLSIAYSNYQYINTIAIGFCGKVYYAIEMEAYPTIKKLCYNVDETDKFVKENSNKDDQECYFAGKKFKRKYWNKYPFRKDIDKFFTNAVKISKLFDEYKCPIFVGKRYFRDNFWPTDKKIIIINGSLREFEFYRVFDVQRAYQEVRMFVTNMAVPDKPLPVIPDDILASAKGFDKYSFRKPPKRRKQ